MNAELESITEDARSRSLFDKVYASLSSNPYFSAGAGLVGIGIVASLGKRLVILSNTLFRRRFVISLSLNNDDA